MSKKPATMTRDEALKLGQKIRNIACMDSLARRFFNEEHQKAIRTICDEAMHTLGYESLTENRDRTHEAFGNWEGMTDEEIKTLYKYRRLGE